MLMLFTILVVFRLSKIDNDGKVLAQQLFDVISEVRRSIRVEEQTAAREFGFVYGALNTVNEVTKTLNEKIASTKASVSNQKELLERAAAGDPTNRDIGERPISIKDQRKFDEIVNNDE